MGNEGLWLRIFLHLYKPGSRVGYGVKIKPTMETLDLYNRSRMGNREKSTMLKLF